jgi:hypothetical protein
MNTKAPVSAWPFPTTEKEKSVTLTEELISINEAAARGIERLRKPIWATPEDHVKIDITKGKPGIWAHLYSPFNKECNGRDPIDTLIPHWGEDAAKEKAFVPYSGPLSDSPEYQEKVKQFEGCLGERK